MIKTGLLLFLSFFALNAAAESYICIATKSVALLELDNGSISMSEVDVSNLKYLLTEEEGNLIFKQFGSKDSIPCSTPYFCTCGHVAWCGQFLSNSAGKFTYYVDRSFSNRQAGSQIVKGNCEKIE